MVVEIVQVVVVELIDCMMLGVAIVLVLVSLIVSFQVSEIL